MINKYKKDGFFYLDVDKLNKEKEIIQKIILKNYNKDLDYYTKLSILQFRKIGLKTKSEVEKTKVINKFRKYVADQIKKKFKIDDELYFTSYFAFLVARPHKKNEETIDFHRESFYAGKSKKYISYQINNWLPIFNLSKNQNLKYIPYSHKIPDNKIKLKNVISNFVKKNSPSHKLGYIYKHRKITKGVNLSKAKRFLVKPNKILCFNSNLIHGNGENLTSKIRFSIAFGIIEKKKYLKNRIKKIKSFRSNKEYYVSYSEL